MSHQLKTESIALKHFTDTDATMLFQLIDKNRDHIGEWLSWVPKTTKVEQTENKIKEWNEREKKKEEITFGIWYQDTLVGVISLMFINVEDKYAEIGYWLDKGHQGKGIITQSCKVVINYGFKELGLHRIEISCALGNDKSRRVAERLGFIKEGTARESGYLHGIYVDHDWYSLLEQEWKE